MEVFKDYGETLKKIGSPMTEAEKRIRPSFDDIEKYCMFIGYPRSGHSLVGSILDAHPNIVIAHELDALGYIQAGISRNQIYSLILENSRNFTLSGRKHNYSFKIPNQWQGKYETLKIIGDKKGGRSTIRLRENPSLLEALRKTIGSELKLVHVIRNPYDNISRMFIRECGGHGDILAYSFRRYFALSDTIMDLKKGMKDGDMLDLRLESLIDHPKTKLKELCEFLGVSVKRDYLEGCASIIFKKPKRSRHEVTWNPETIVAVKKKMSEYPFLRGYTYDS